MEHLRLLSEPEQRSEAFSGTGPVGFDFCEPNNRSRYLSARKKKKKKNIARSDGEPDWLKKKRNATFT